MERLKSDWDWVKARLDCSLSSMYLVLKELVGRDVAAIGGYRGAKFEIKNISAETFIVAKTWDAGGIQSGEAVTFALQVREHRIQIRNTRTSEQMFIAVPEVDADGVCRFRVDDKLLDTWQLSQKALEGLFFG